MVLERLHEISEIPKGNGLIGQIVPMLDYRGLLERFRGEATWAGPIPAFSFGSLQLNSGGWSGCSTTASPSSAAAYGAATS